MRIVMAAMADDGMQLVLQGKCVIGDCVVEAS